MLWSWGGRGRGFPAAYDFAACPGSGPGLGAAVCRWPRGPWGCGDRVWAGQAGVGGRPGGGFEQVHPLVLAVPALGQVQGDLAAAVAGSAGGDVDEVAAQLGASGFGVGEAGQGTGGA